MGNAAAGSGLAFNHAYYNALWLMIDLMTKLYGINRLNALSLSSLIVEMRVTQHVNGTNGAYQRASS